MNLIYRAIGLYRLHIRRTAKHLNNLPYEIVIPVNNFIRRFKLYEFKN